MSNRRGRPPIDDDEFDEGPTREKYVGPPSHLTPSLGEPTDGILTDNDIDVGVPTLPRHHAPVPRREVPLPRFEGTGSLTLPRGFLASSAVPEVPLPPIRLEAPSPSYRLPPPTPFRVLPPPPRLAPGPAPRRPLDPGDDGDSSFSLAPTPIRPLPSEPPPKPRRQPRSEPPTRPLSAPPPPAPPWREPAPAEKRQSKAERPRPRLASTPSPSESTRPFALHAPTRPLEPSPSVPEVELDPRLAVAVTNFEAAGLETLHRPSAPPPSPSAPPQRSPSMPPSHPSVPPPAAQASTPPPGRSSVPSPAHLSTPPPHPSVPPAHAARVPTERPPRPRPSLRARGPQDPTLRAATIGVAAALAIGALFVAFVVSVRSSHEAERPQGPVLAARPLSPLPPTAQPIAPGSPTPAETPGFSGCSLARTVQRLTSAALPSVPPMGAPAPGLNRVALGFASSRNHAEGVIVDLDDLSVETRFSEELARPVFRVTPLTDRSPVTFAVDMDHPNVQVVRTLAASPPLRVGVSFFGFVRVNDSTEPTVIWPGSRNDAVGELSFAVTERDGHGVAFRSGRTSGDIFAGWLTPSGTADGDLVRIDAGAREVGAPAIAASDDKVAVVFPARGAGESWRLRVAIASRAKVPRTSRELDLGSLSADALSPSLVPLGNGGWLMQWIEGSGAARRVVVRTLDHELVPSGLPIEIASGAGIQDTPGALIVRAGRVLAVHLSATERSVGLWAAVLRCS